MFPASALAGNYATCLLDNLPGVANDSASVAAIRLCIGKYPGGFTGVKKGSGRGLFSFDSGAECALKKGGSTSSQHAGRMIAAACNTLYDLPELRPEQFERSAAKPWNDYKSAEEFLDGKR